MIYNFRLTDWLDDERVSQTGEFRVHRNYMGNDGQFIYSRSPGAEERSINSTHDQGNKATTIYIGNTPPIATGITAFFVCDYYNLPCLKSCLEKHSKYETVKLNKEYFDYCIQPDLINNSQSPNPDSSENVKKRFIPIHLKEERLKLEESKKYFEECKNAKDEKINSEIKGFVNGYFNWLTNNIKYEHIDTLENACKGPEEYKSIIAWFIQNDLCDPNTLIWKDRKTGYKKSLAGYLKDLHIRGYTEELTDIEIQNIAQNSFHLKIGISTIQHPKANKESKIPPFLTE